MDYRLTISDLGNMLIDSNQSRYHIDQAGTKEVKHHFALSHMNVQLTELVFEHFHVKYGNAHLHKLSTLEFTFTGETVEMSFILKGNTVSKLKGMDEYYTSHESTHNIFYNSNIEGDIRWLNHHIYIFEVNIKPNFFLKYLPNGSTFDLFKNQILNRQPSYLLENRLLITAPMLHVIQEIISCPYQDHFRRMFIESKILELLILQMEQMKEFREGEVNSSTKEKMYYAKELITNNLINPLSLSELSLALQTNECSLKKDFKATFGTTVFGYLKQLKMEEAKRLLLTGKYIVSEVAEKVGYKNPQHFTAAFKKFHGYLPSTLLKK